MSADDVLAELHAAEIGDANTSDRISRRSLADALASAAYYANDDRTPGRSHRDLLSEAVAIYRELLADPSRDGNTADLTTNLGAALSDLGKHRQAASILRTGITLPDADHNTFWNLAVALTNCGATGRSESRTFFAEAATLERTPGTRPAHAPPTSIPTATRTLLSTTCRSSRQPCPPRN